MPISRTLVLALVTACAFSASALAQTTSTMPASPSTGAMPTDGMMMKEGMTMVVMPDGKMSTMQMSDKMMSDAMMKEGKVMTGAHMMMMSGGKVYAMDDKKMSDGKMMSETMMMKK